MAYTALQLISSAYYLSGVTARGFNVVSGPQAAEGLELLNDLLAEKNFEPGMIPFYSSDTFTGVIGQETYTVTGLIAPTTVTFELNNVRYSMTRKSQIEYQGMSRSENVNSLPTCWYPQRTQDGTTISVYFFPDQAYVFTVEGKFILTQVASLETDIESYFERGYRSFLKYQLAERISDVNDLDLSPRIQKRLEYYYQILDSKMSSIDLEVQKISTFTTQGALNYAQVNLGEGWTAP